MSLSWKETSPGRFERPFDSIEIFFKTLAAGGAPLNREHWAVSAVVQFRNDSAASSHEIEHALRQSWLAMRHDHPEIASFAEGDNKIYEVADEASAQVWLKSTFLVHELPEETPNTLLASFKPELLATCHYFPHSSEILMHTSHWRMDGIGFINFMHNFFQAFVNPRSVEFGDEASRLGPGMDEAAGFVNSTTVEAEQESNALLMKYFGNLPTMGLPTKENQIPGATRRSELMLGPETTAALVAACKRNNLTVTSAIHAASIIATRDLNPTSATKYTSFGAFNYRPFLPSPFKNSSNYPVNVNLVGLPITLTPTTFFSTATEVQNFYKQPLSPTENNFKSIIAPYTRKFAALASTPPPPDMPMPSEPTVNSVGIIDKFLSKSYGDNVEITKFWLGVEMLTRQLDLYVWTWQSKMVISACYNEEFFDDEFAINFYKICVEISIKELKIEVGEDWSL